MPLRASPSAVSSVVRNDTRDADSIVLDGGRAPHSSAAAPAKAGPPPLHRLRLPETALPPTTGRRVLRGQGAGGSMVVRVRLGDDRRDVHHRLNKSMVRLSKPTVRAELRPNRQQRWSNSSGRQCLERH